MRTFAATLCLALCCSSAQAQNSPDLLLPVKVDGKWGYINGEGKMVIQPLYEGVSRYTGDLAVMQANSLRGVINREGKVLIPAAYKEVRIIGSDLVAVKKNAWGIKDTSGSLILEEEYEGVKALSDTIVTFRSNGRWGAMDLISGNRLAPDYDSVTLLPANFICINRDGLKGVATKNMRIIYSPFADAFACPAAGRTILFRKGGLWGAGNSEGKKASEAVFGRFEFLSPNFIRFRDTVFSALYSAVQNKFINTGRFHNFCLLGNGYIAGILRDKSRTLRYALLDSVGRELLPPLFNYISDGKEGFFLVRKDSLWGFANGKGKIILEPCFQRIDRFRNGLARVEESGKQGILNASGQLIVPAKYEAVQIFDETAKCYANGEMDLIIFDETGKITETLHYKNVRTLEINGNEIWSFNPRLSMPNRNSNRNRDTIKVNDLFLISKPSRYPPNSRIRSDIHGNFRNVWNLYGMRDSARVILKPEFWNLEIQDFAAGTYARCIYEGGRHGFINRRGSVILDFPVLKNGHPSRERIAYIGDFSDGLVRVNLGGKLSTEGKSEEVIYSDYQSLLWYNGIYCNGGKWGFANPQGQMVIRAEFDYVHEFKNQVAIVVKDGKYGVINTSGEFIIPAGYDKIEYLPNSSEKLFRLTIYEPKKGILSVSGRVILPAVYEHVAPFSGGLALVSKGKGYGFADESGNLVIPDTFRDAQSFSEGLAAVKIRNKWGYIDTNGNLVIAPAYHKAGRYSNGLAVVQVNHRAGIIDRNGQYIMQPRLTDALDFENGYSVARYKGKYGILDTRGKWVIQPRFRQINPFNEHGICQVKKGKKYFLCHTSGKRISASYEKILPFSEGLAAVKTKKYWGYVDTTGREVIRPRFFKAGNFSEGLARYATGGKWGYIGRNGDEVILSRFRFAGDFREGFAPFIDHGKLCLINRTGEVVHKLNSSWMTPFREGLALIKTDSGKIFIDHFGAPPFPVAFEDAVPFENGVALVKQKGKWGLMNKAGILTSSYIYDHIEPVLENKAIYTVSSFSGIADLRGNILVETEFEQVNFTDESLFCLERSGALFYMSPEGKWIWKP